jgi:GDP-L-fucose synthase
MRIFLTGSAGMVGKNILASAQAKSHVWLTPNRNELDLKNQKDVVAYIKNHQPDLIIHAAGRVGGIQANIKNPVAFLTENTEIGKNVILSAQEAGVKKLLNLSSSCMYPRNAPNPLSEDMILKGELEPTNEGYALAKIFAMKLCEYIQKEDSRFEYKTLIPCNLYGEHDKFAPEHSHLIPAIIHKIHLAKVNGLSKVEIWGDGKARREFMLASDLADCVMTCVEQFSKVPNLMNVGLGFDYSVNEFYQTAAKVIGYQGEFYHDLSKPTGMQQKLVSVSRLTEFGWKPKTTLADGMKKTYEFYLKQFNE